ncbi:MAG: hypothetical protein EP333_06860 [Bacteroidetes bacterium]|nr:MAG: hypothetical protein EP333_06860 [Bacteroidota bacterium]
MKIILRLFIIFICIIAHSQEQDETVKFSRNSLTIRTLACGQLTREISSSSNIAIGYSTDLINQFQVNEKFAIGLSVGWRQIYYFQCVSAITMGANTAYKLNDRNFLFIDFRYPIYYRRHQQSFIDISKDSPSYQLPNIIYVFGELSWIHSYKKWKLYGALGCTVNRFTDYVFPYDSGDKRIVLAPALSVGVGYAIFNSASH